jgi:beta-mannanase/fibronectin type 3 domain-containing protein
MKQVSIERIHLSLKASITPTVVSLALIAAIAPGGKAAVYDFNSGLPAGSIFQGSSGYGLGITNAGGSTNSGCIVLTRAISSTQIYGQWCITNDLANGAAITNFNVSFKLYVGRGSGGNAPVANPGGNGAVLHVGPTPTSQYTGSASSWGNGLDVTFRTYSAAPNTYGVNVEYNPSTGTNAPGAGTIIATNSCLRYFQTNGASDNFSEAATVGVVLSNAMLSVTITPTNGVTTNVYNNLVIPGFVPITPARMAFTAGSGAGAIQDAWIDDVNVTVNSAGTTNCAPPTAPTGLTATGGNAQIALGWTASAGASSYTVKRSTSSSGPYTNIASGITATSYTDSGLPAGTTFYYVVDAVNGCGPSGDSAYRGAATIPAAPSGLSATAGNTQAILSWNGSTGASSYNVKRSTTNGGPYTVLTNVMTTGFTNTGLANGTTYYYVVSALNGSGESGNSSQVSATPTGSTPISFVRASQNLVTTGGSSISTTLANNAGDALVVASRQGTDGTSISSVTDSAGNTYRLVNNSSSGTRESAVFVATNVVASSGNTVTCTFKSSLSSVEGIVVLEFANAAPLDGQRTSTNTGSVTSLSSGTITTTQSGDVLVYAVNTSVNESTWTAGGGYTIPANGSNARQAVEYFIAGAPGAQSTSVSWNASGSADGEYLALAPATTSGTNTPPSITTQPRSQTVNVGANVTFSVGATGTAPLSYQWRFNGGSISGATSSSYTKNNVQTSDAGNYSVVVTNAYGSVTSSNAVLTVNNTNTPGARWLGEDGTSLAAFNSEVNGVGQTHLAFSTWGSLLPNFSSCAAAITTNANDGGYTMWSMQASTNNAGILSAAFDSYLQTWAANAAADGRKFLLRFDHEFNGNWYVWGYGGGHNGNTPQNYAQAWIHVHNIFTAAGATNVYWVWCPNVGWSNDGAYPGDAYVDYVGMDGYNNNTPWLSFTSLFQSTYNAVTALTAKPVIVCETSCVESGGSKANWISSAFTNEIPSTMPLIIGVQWFNEGSFIIDTSPSALAAFQAVAGSPQWRATFNFDR